MQMLRVEGLRNGQVAGAWTVKAEHEDRPWEPRWNDLVRLSMNVLVSVKNEL